jgi:four helix bundle protein
MATLNSFEELEVWKASRDICREIGEIIDKGSLRNNYRLINQIEGSSGSIMDNIAEGFERGTKAEFIQFLGYSKGSCGEFRSQLFRLFDRKYIDRGQFDELNSKSVMISKMLQKFIVYLQKITIEGNRKKK